jgi:hypothetical protein
VSLEARKPRCTATVSVLDSYHGGVVGMSCGRDATEGLEEGPPRCAEHAERDRRQIAAAEQDARDLELGRNVRAMMGGVGHRGQVKFYASYPEDGKVTALLVRFPQALAALVSGDTLDAAVADAAAKLAEGGECPDDCPGCSSCYESNDPLEMGWIGKDGKP